MAERLKQPLLCVVGNPNPGIRHRDANGRRLLRLRLDRHLHDHIAAFGKFDRVRCQVHHNLPETPGVAEQVARDIGMEEAGKIEPFR